MEEGRRKDILCFGSEVVGLKLRSNAAIAAQEPFSLPQTPLNLSISYTYIMSDLASPIAGPSTGRTSNRVKNKSQRAIESEDTQKLIARARERARLAAEGEAGSNRSGSVVTDGAPIKSGPKKVSGKKGKPGKRKEREYWCLCKSTDGSGPMIECWECNDWFVSKPPCSAQSKSR